jgi:hypothetical protein
MILIFGLSSSSGFVKILKSYLHESVAFLDLYKGEMSPLLFNPVRNLGVLTFLILFVWAEHTMRENIHPIRLGIIISTLTIYIYTGINYQLTDNLLTVDSLLPFAQDTRLGELAYDILGLVCVITPLYAFIKQYRVVKSNHLRRLISTMFASFFFLIGGLIYELNEHFFPIPDIDMSYFIAPAFLIAGYIYIRNPNFIYFASAEVNFLQIIRGDGLLIYAVEIQNRGIDTGDYLVAPSLTSFGVMFKEIVRNENAEVKEIRFNQGSILYEQIDNLVLVLQSTHSSRILHRAMRYLLREFKKEFGEGLNQDNITKAFENNLVNPEVLIQRCIPVVESTQLITITRE